MNKLSEILLLRELWGHIGARQKSYFYALTALMVATSVIEIVSIGSVLPFLAILSDPSKASSYWFLQWIFDNFSIRSPNELLAPLAISYGILAIFAAFMRLFLIWATTKLSFETGADLGARIYERILYQPYYAHLKTGSSEVISGITSKANDAIYHILLPILTLLSSSMLLFAILGVLIFLEPLLTIVTFTGFALSYLIAILLVKNRLVANGELISTQSVAVIRAIQDGLGGIRDIILDGTQNVFLNIYKSADSSFRKAQAGNLFLAQSPRFIVEALGMLIIACIALALIKRGGGIEAAVPVLGVLALSAQRMLPILQQAYLAYSGIKGGQESLKSILELLGRQVNQSGQIKGSKEICFEDQLVLRDVSFKYEPNLPWALEGVSFSIKKGSCVGFIGKTGSGKSTLLDLVMGLLVPQKGSLTIDGVMLNSTNLQSWQFKLAHVPQNIFLVDASVTENIAFGVPSHAIDFKRVCRAAAQAQIADAIESWPEAYKTKIGERGVRLSGGQRQRIGIARALYKNADVIIFDEATSALDSETEKVVMEAIENLGKDLTILIIAHRHSTLKACSEIIELANGKIQTISTSEKINQSNES